MSKTQILDKAFKEINFNTDRQQEKYHETLNEINKDILSFIPQGFSFECFSIGKLIALKQGYY